jgi:hypothetical protein
MDLIDNININISLIDKSLKNNKNNKINYINLENTIKKERNSISLYNFSCDNNIKICKKIKEINDFTRNYDIIIDYNPIKIGNMSERVLDHYDIIPTNDAKYVLLQYNGLDSISFNTFLFNLPNPKLFIFHIIDSYSVLLNSLNKLNQNGVCFFNLSIKNIIFDRNYKPLLKNFESSILIESLNDEYISNIIESLEDYTHKPLEIHVIFYLIKNNENTLSHSSIEVICENFVKNMSILSLFSQQYKNTYYNTCVECLKKYINKPKIDIIKNIINIIKNNSSIFDNYSISVLYLHIIGNLIKVFSLKESFMTQIINSLTKNIHPDPLKRETTKNSIVFFERIFNDYNDWSFINKIPLNKMELLYKTLKLT